MTNGEIRNSLMDIPLERRDAGNVVREIQIDEQILNARVNIGKRKQVLATIIANMSTLTVALTTLAACPWPMFNSIGLMVVPFVAIILGLLFSYLLCECFGRKITLCLTAIPLIICYALIPVPEDRESSMSAFFFGAFGGSMCLFTLPIYVSEISCDSMRGTLGSMRMIFMTIGLTNIHFKIQVDIVVFFILILIIGMYFVPESPVYLARMSQSGETTRPQMLRDDNNVQSTDNELSRIDLVVRRIRKLGPCILDGIETIKSLFRGPENRRAFIVVFGLLTIQSLWEVDRLLKYHKTEVIIWTAVPILGSVLATILINCVGRRTLLLISCIGQLLYSLVGFIIEFEIARNNVIILSGGDFIYMIYIYTLPILFISSYYLGLGTVTSVIAVEVFQREVLASGYMISLGISWIVMFVVICIRILFHSSYIFNSVLADQIIRLFLYICCPFFTYYLVPETKVRAIQ